MMNGLSNGLATAARGVVGGVPPPARVTGRHGEADGVLSDALWAAMKRELDRTRIPGAQAAVRRNGTLLWSASAGRIELTGRDKGAVGREDRFVIASATKLVVACVAMSMAERGELNLDEPIGKWLPDLPNAERLTVRMLLGHTSGLREYFEDKLLGRRLRHEPFYLWTRREVLEAVQRLGAEAKPGERYTYRNSNYVALGEILELCAGKSLESLVRERIAKPLGLRTLSFVTDSSDGSRVASPHVAVLGRVFDPLSRTGGEIPSHAAGEVWADGGIASSAEDLAAFTEALFGGGLLQPETVEAMTEPNEWVPQGSYGLGVGIWEYKGARLLGHNGMYLGWSSIATFDTRSRATVSVFANLAGMDVPAERVMGALWEVLA